MTTDSTQLLASISASTDSELAAKSARLRYVTDKRPGIRRKRSANGAFRYFDHSGDPVNDEETLRRIRSLAIPPAYEDVWICPIANGHLQATGRDERGRKQYRYHPRWRSARDETKFARMVPFAEALPAIRRHVDADLKLPGLPCEKILAALVRLLETTLIRVGNEEYARSNRSFGLTTLQLRHVDIDGASIHFSFRGKSGKQHKIDLKDRRLARVVSRCKELPGREVFQYVDESGETRSICSENVNEYIQRITCAEFTAKDFRTWAGTVIAYSALFELGPCDQKTQIKHNIVNAIAKTAEELGNTPAVCRKSYVHPEVVAAFEDGSMFAAKRGRQPRAATNRHGLSAAERSVLTFLKLRSSC